MLKAKYFAGCLVAVSVFFSCKKDEAYDITGDAGTKFFTNNESPGNAPVNSINYNAVNYPDAAGSGLLNLSTTVPGTIKFPVFSTKPVGEDVVIGAELDNSLIAEYNAANNTNYVAFPAGVLNNTSGLMAHLPKGATRSVDSLSITADLTKLNTLTEKAYMAPVKLTTVSSPAAGVITTNKTSKVAYIVVNVEQRKIKYLAAAAEAQGALVTPRTAWSVIYNPAPTLTGTGSIFDASTTTYVRWSASPAQVDVNMQATKNVTGLRLYTSNSATYTPTQIEVYLSNDGVTYDLIGAPLKANLTYASSYNYILFYKAIPAKYIRLKLYYSTSTNTQNFRLTEFDVYAN